VRLLAARNFLIGIPRRFCFLDRYDLVSLLGLALMAIGLYMVYAPLALIIPGALLIVAGVMGARP
jgi:hypothetical protein